MYPMYPWESMRLKRSERRQEEHRQPLTVVALTTPTFTEEQRLRLVALREQVDIRRLVEEYDLNAQRLMFARWLVTHGRISDDL